MKTTRTSPSQSRSTKARGNMKPAEIKPLVMAARKAWNRQSELGLTKPGETFDTWRHQQCMDAVGKPGITACHHHDFRPLLAHFQTLSGDDPAAFDSLMITGPARDHSEPGDTHEARRVLAHQIAQAIADHEALAAADPASLDPAAATRHAAIAAKGSTVGIGYLVWLARQKTRRPDLTLGSDWQTALADRCTARQLTELRNTIINRIAAVEGTGSTRTRNRSQRSRKPAGE